MTITSVTWTIFYTAEAGKTCPLPPAAPVDGNVTLTVEEDLETGEFRCANTSPYQDFGTFGVEPNTSPGLDTTGTMCWGGPAITGL